MVCMYYKSKPSIPNSMIQCVEGKGVLPHLNPVFSKGGGETGGGVEGEEGHSTHP
jgi:hypothetical protein